ncbi:Metal dependent phosphohydrolase (modular protein) [Burkholderiales bacterium]|nr:Metal dependent phosphohydrolase (modular protein) [Burkholderiales bacterium]
MANVVPNPVLTDRFAQAFAFASIVHASQTRKGTAIPYVSHVIGVASLVLEHGADEDTAIAALLHDAPEDQGGYAMLAQIKARFGDRVEKIVEGCTDTFESPKPEWVKRKTDYLARLADEYGGVDIATCTVAVADKLHNARSILQDLRNGVAVFDRFSADQEKQGWYFGSLARMLHKRLAGEEAMPLAGALLHAIEEISAHKGCEMFGVGVEKGFRGVQCPG